MRTSALALCLLLLMPPARADVDPAARPVDRPGLGRLIRLTSVTDVDGAAHALAGQTTVLIMTSPDCPLSRRYAPVHARLAATRRVIWIDVHGADTPDRLRAFARRHGFGGALVHDPQRQVARALGALTTTETFVLDAGRTLVYRGATDDQYGLSTALPAPRRRWLADALTALAAGRTPAVRSTSSPGCDLGTGDGTPAAETTLTWHGTVQRLVRNHCGRCHRTGGVAPFPLETYAQARAHAPMMGWMVKKQRMPPWFAAPGHGPWANDRSLPARDKAELLAWLASKDKPKGDPADAPAPARWPTEWRHGKPDAIVELPRAVTIKAEGTMPYVNLKVKTDWDRDRWVRAWEVRPTARDVVHHVLVFVQPPGQRRLFRERSGFFAAFVPGNASAAYPDGLAKRVPAGSTLHFQLHYTPSGEERSDRTRLGLYFTDTPRHEIRTVGASNVRIRIPAGAADHRETAALPVPWEVRLLGLMPHMHYRGKAFRYTVGHGGKTSTLLDVPRYDFNWQLAYWYREPKTIPAGSRIEVRATFDNSSANRANPDPAAEVRWGPQSTDEMLIGYIEYYIPSVKAGEEPPKVQRRPGDGALALYDKDGDQRISLAECPPKLKWMFGWLDRNKDGFVDRAELARRRKRPDGDDGRR